MVTDGTNDLTNTLNDNYFMKSPNQGLMTDVTDDECTCGLHSPITVALLPKGDVSHLGRSINDLSL